MKRVLKCVAIACVIGSSLHVQAQGTAFSHQGFLTDGGESANGVFDLHFTPYDAATAGTAQAASNIFTAVQISNGLFTVTLDFGASVFSGSARWLETAVRSNGAASFTTLSPRQPLLPAPYAIYARGVVASGIVGTISSGQIGTGAISNGNLAVAVQTNITARLDSNTWALANSTTNYLRRTGDTMTGPLTVTNAGGEGLRVYTGDGNYGHQQVGPSATLATYVNASGGWIGTRTQDPLLFYVNDGGNSMILSTNAFLGIGATTPNARLHVNGNAIISGVVTASAFSGNGAQLTGLSGGQLAAGTVSNTHLAAEVSTTFVRRIGDTMSGTLVLSNSAQFSERLRLSGQEYYGAADNSSNGIAFLTGVNRTDNRQLWIADSARLGYTGSNSAIRLSPGTGLTGAFIDAIGTDGVTGLGLTLGTGSLMHLSPSGKVGIGTSAPVVPLDVSQTSPGHLLRLNNMAGEGGIAGLMFSRTNQFMGQIGYVGITNQIGYAGSGDVIFGSYNGANLRFDASPDGVEAMRLVVKASNGFVGIGTYTPTDELTVHGDIGLTYNTNRVISVGMQPDNNTEGQNLTIAAGAASSSGVPFLARKGGDLILTAGNGFNASVPDKDGGDVIIRSGANSQSGTDNGGDIVLQTGAANNTFVERMRIMESGNVGIGTTNPTALLHVGGNATISGTLTATAFSGSGGQITAGTISNSHLATAVQTNITARLASNVWAAADATTNYVRRTGDTMTGTLNLPAGGLVVASTQLVVTSAGNVGIGTATPASRLTVQSSSDADVGFRVTDGTTNGNVVIQALSGGLSGFSAINFNGYYNGGEQRFNTSKARWRMYADQRGTADTFVLERYNGSALAVLSALTNGNVGIGTASPNAQLHVLGNQIVSGVVTASAFVGSANGLTIGSTQLVATAGGIAIGTASVSEGALVVNGVTHQNDYDILLRSGTDRNHGLGWYGTGKLFGNVNVDGRPCTAIRVARSVRCMDLAPTSRCSGIHWATLASAQPRRAQNSMLLATRSSAAW